MRFIIYGAGGVGGGGVGLREDDAVLYPVKVGEGAGAKGGERVGEGGVELAGEARVVLVGVRDFGEDLLEVEDEARARGDGGVCHPRRRATRAEGTRGEAPRRDHSIAVSGAPSAAS